MIVNLEFHVADERALFQPQADPFPRGAVLDEVVLWVGPMEILFPASTAFAPDAIVFWRRSEQNTARTKIWKMVESGDYCCEDWYLHFSGKCQ